MRIFLICFIWIASQSFVFADPIYGYKGDILYFTKDPAKNTNAYEYIKSGVLYVEDGKVLNVGPYSQLKSQYQDAVMTDYSGKLIVPGFIDLHVHYPQTEMIASYGGQLLDWLNNYTFPAEKQFSDKAHAQKVAHFFIKQLIANGTTTALVFSTVSPVSVDAFFQAAEDKNMRMISGKVLMDRNAPSYLLDDPATAYEDSTALIKKWHNKGRLKYAVTVRFAPTSTEAELTVAGKLLQEHPGVYFQTHLAENKAEVAWVHALFPSNRSYLDVYKQFGLVTNLSVFAHGIYLDDEDFELLAEKGSAIAFCPTSNLFLGSGLFNLNKAIQYNVNVGLGTDVGAGTSFSQLQTMNEAYKVIQLRKAYSDHPSSEQSLDSLEAFYLATLGGAKALHLENNIGSFEPGREADFIVLNPQATSLMADRMKANKTINDELFVFMMLGDDRAVEHTYIMGKKEK